jgi:hypothetical protein
MAPLAGVDDNAARVWHAKEILARENAALQQENGVRGERMVV